MCVCVCVCVSVCLSVCVCVCPRCQVYTCFILSMLFSCFLLVIQADMEWPSLANSYFLTIIMVFHNIIVWLHLTETFPEVLLLLCWQALANPRRKTICRRHFTD